jgi:hypothetical protein
VGTRASHVFFSRKEDEKREKHTHTYIYIYVKTVTGKGTVHPAKTLFTRPGTVGVTGGYCLLTGCPTATIFTVDE